MCYNVDTKNEGEPKMTTFTIIILILFVGVLSFQLIAAIVKNCLGLATLFAFEIMAFAYLAKVLM